MQMEALETRHAILIILFFAKKKQQKLNLKN